MFSSLATSDGFQLADREQRAWIPRYGIIVATACLIGTVYQNMSTFEPQAAVDFTKYAIVLGANLHLLFWWSTTKWFSRLPIVDLLVTLPLIYWMHLVKIVMLTQVYLTHWDHVSVTTSNYLLGIAFASIFFPANFKAYLVWIFLFFTVYAIGLSELHASSVEIIYGCSAALPISLIIIYSAWSVEQKSRDNYKLRVSLAAEKDKSDEMLYSILPEECQPARKFDPLSASKIDPS